ncbi:hypothetical protein M747DRAFT_81928 [Aspergillus niger ATCC 13496]|uniref:Uncharacterized protein n=1 Tax=Aspergillus niger ATCC 13496 TaxID=1353008 RepID=A0A370BWZ2_ASPNG|nr:hypothetical protein M747DRAFT_81928 [Aspergillus niger ATCC 13496]
MRPKDRDSCRWPFKPLAERQPRRQGGVRAPSRSSLLVFPHIHTHTHTHTHTDTQTQTHPLIHAYIHHPRQFCLQIPDRLRPEYSNPSPAYLLAYRRTALPVGTNGPTWIPGTEQPATPSPDHALLLFSAESGRFISIAPTVASWKDSYFPVSK